MITTVKHALWLTYFYLISPRSWLTAPGWRNYCGLLGWGDFTSQTTLFTGPVGGNQSTRKEIYDCRLTAPGWRESLRSYGLRRFYNPNHPINIAYGRKPEYPEEIYDCRQSVYELLTQVSRIWSGNRTHDLKGDRRLLWRLRHLVITVQDQTILHEKFKFPRVGSCFTVIIL